MSLPIDIPLTGSRLQGAAPGRPVFPEEDGPYMGYTEIFENGNVWLGVSSGSGNFVKVDSRCEMPALSFMVEKDWSMKNITIEIISRDLRQTVSRVIHKASAPALLLALDLRTVLRHYDALKAELEVLSFCHIYDELAREMQLLVDDLLLARSLYNGVANPETLRQAGILSVAHLQDIQQRNTVDFDGMVQACILSDPSSEDEIGQFLSDQKSRVAELALAGDLNELRDFCEPLVWSREVEVPYDPSLLLQLLDSGRRDVYEYILEVTGRTRRSPAQVPNLDFSDVTYDPLCVAIRLGHSDAVQSLVANHATFIGYIQDDLALGNDRVFTPLVAAAYWKQLDIAGVLMRSGPMYTASLPQALQLAHATGSSGLVQALTERPSPSSWYGPMTDRYPQPSPCLMQYQVPRHDLALSAFSQGLPSPWINNSVTAPEGPEAAIDDADYSFLSAAQGDPGGDYHSRDDYSSPLLTRARPGYGQSCPAVDKFFGFQSEHESSYDSGIGMGSPGNGSLSQWMQDVRMADEGNTGLGSLFSAQASSTGPTDPHQALHPQGALFPAAEEPGSFIVPPATIQPAIIQPAMIQPAMIQPAMIQPTAIQPAIALPVTIEPPMTMPSHLEADQRPDASQEEPSPSPGKPSAITAQHPSGAKTKSRKLCDKCGKTFSNISNLNKHKVQGCAYRTKVTFPCRFQALGCTQDLTTKWYQKTHERERCHYNPEWAKTGKRGKGRAIDTPSNRES